MQQAYAEQYRSLWQRHWWWQARKEYVLHWIRKVTGEARVGNILDIGCGDGLFLDELSQFGEAWGVEPDERLLTEGSPWRSRIEIAPFGPEYKCERKYDLVLMLDVLEHIECDRGALAASARLLEPGGCLILTVPALQFLWSVHDEANCHFRRYRRRGLRKLLSGAGLEVIAVRYYFGWTLAPLLLRRVLGNIGRGRRREVEEYRVSIPPGPINGAMRWLSLLEQLVTFRRGLPLGSSLFAIARRPKALPASISHVSEEARSSE